MFVNPQQDAEDVLKIYIPRHNHDDRIVWPFSKSRQLTRKSMYKVLRKRNNDHTPNNSGIYRLEEILEAPLSAKNLVIWMEMSFEGLYVRIHLNTKISSINALCPICEANEEIVEHVFFFFNQSRATWFCVSIGLYCHHNSKVGMLEYWWIEFLEPS